jgi:hypothetical protein
MLKPPATGRMQWLKRKTRRTGGYAAHPGINPSSDPARGIGDLSAPLTRAIPADH